MTGLYKVLGVPFGFVLRLIYESIGFHSYAVSIILLTLLARVFMLPSGISQQKGMAKTQRMQAKMRRIQAKYAGDQKKIQEETQALYQREGYNPMNAGCAPMLIQFLLLFGLIGAIYYPLSNFLPNISDSEVSLLTEAVKNLNISSFSSKSTIINELLVIQHIDKLQGIEGVSQATYNAISGIDFSFFGLFNLGDVPMDFKGSWHPIWLIPILSTLSTLGSTLYSQIKQKASNAAGAAGKSMGCMMIFMAAFSLYFVVNYPAGIGIYWIASSLFGLISTVVIGKIYSPKKMVARLMVEETIQRRSRENSLKLVAQRNSSQK
ncbi:MAG: YidC/Oxa1 family membrane protein insertase [Clostridiales bacterium]|nr:YidC/Oxa1 family membrane protein insertase [Clostridiales bacterium]